MDVVYIILRQINLRHCVPDFIKIRGDLYDKNNVVWLTFFWDTLDM